MAHTTSYTDMPLWQRSVDLAAEVSQLVAGLPGVSGINAASDVQDAVLSIPTLLAKGSKANKAAFRTVCLRACQTITEIETLLYVLQRIYSDLPLEQLLGSYEELFNGLTIMARRLGEAKAAKPTV